jgi:hypothetical protein
MKNSLLKYLSILFIITFSIPVINAQMIKTNPHKDGYVPNKETAVKIAEAIWLPIYGSKIYNYTPFIAELKNDNIWIVRGTLKTEKGGVPYIEIQKSDCKILKVIHGK